MKLNYKQSRAHSVGVAAGIAAVMAALFVPEVVLASQNIGTMADNIAGNFTSLAKLITAAAYLGGLGFAVGAILKFKQHKDNPTQVPIGTPIAMLIVAASMIFLPTILGITGESIFATTGTVGGPTGKVFGT